LKLTRTFKSKKIVATIRRHKRYLHRQHPTVGLPPTYQKRLSFRAIDG
jgi:hypothetical protein